VRQHVGSEQEPCHILMAWVWVGSGAAMVRGQAEGRGNVSVRRG